MTVAFIVKIDVEEKDIPQVQEDLEEILSDYYDVEDVKAWDRNAVQQELGQISQQPQQQADGPVLGG